MLQSSHCLLGDFHGSSSRSGCSSETADRDAAEGKATQGWTTLTTGRPYLLLPQNQSVSKIAKISNVENVILSNFNWDCRISG